MPPAPFMPQKHANVSTSARTLTSVTVAPCAPGCETPQAPALPGAVRSISTPLKRLFMSTPSPPSLKSETTGL
jgi:hypothetical protein